MRFKNYYTFSISQLKDSKRMTKTLELLFKECNSEFKKAEFAHLLSQTLKTEDITDEIKSLLTCIMNR